MADGGLTQTPAVVVGGGWQALDVLDVVEAARPVSLPRLRVVAWAAEGASAPVRAAMSERDFAPLSLSEALDVAGRSGVLLAARPEQTSIDGPWTSVCHPTATIGGGVVLGAGTVLCAGVSIGSQVTTGPRVWIGANASVGHDAVLGQDAALGAGAVVSGRVRLGPSAQVGEGAVVLEELSMGEGSVLSPGSCLTRDLPAFHDAHGVPARPEPQDPGPAGGGRR